MVIGLREGLEAALIVGIIAAFLKRNGKALKAMWIGVTLAVVLSILVGVALTVVERALPQTEQEAMETIIGGVAVVFVTGMIVWMRTHARYMKRELEHSATEALGQGTSLALAAMAFLAVLKEGFETSVFLLATFQASTSVVAAVIGAVVGILISIGIGIGLYTGGVKLNLGKFFTATGVFLVFVAAGLVISALRTAHEAGWIVFGQQPTVDLAWLAPGGSIRAALITGVLGIPADPRTVEAVGWFLYIIPMLLITLLPRALRPKPAHQPRAHGIVAAGLGVGAIALFVAMPDAPRAAIPASVPLGSSGSVSATGESPAPVITVRRAGESTTVRFAAGDGAPSTHAGADTRWRTTVPVPQGPRRLTLDRLVKLNDGSIPVGLSPRRNPGPYEANWKRTATVTAWTKDGALVDAKRTSRTIVTLTGGGLSGARVVTVDPTGDWSAAPDAVAANADAVGAADAAARDRALWTFWLPGVLAIGAIATALRGLVIRRKLTKQDDERAPETAGVPTTNLNDTSRRMTNAT
nr:iron uptake transporter permease EfeU [Spelaeicoccus albus]